MQYRIVITRCCLIGVGWDCAVISVHHATYHVSLISRLPSKRWIARWSSCFDQARGTHMPTSLRGGEGRPAKNSAENSAENSAKNSAEKRESRIQHSQNTAFFVVAGLIFMGAWQHQRWWVKLGIGSVADQQLFRVHGGMGGGASPPLSCPCPQGGWGTSRIVNRSLNVKNIFDGGWLFV